MTRFALQYPTRRAALAGLGAGMLSALAAGRARALTVLKGTVVGKDGWLFLVWDDPRKVDAQKMHVVTDIIGNAVKTFKSAGIDVVLVLTPAKARVYRDFLPDDFNFSPEAERRYSDALTALRQSGALVPDLATMFAALRKSNPDQKIFYQSDTHWTAFGAESAAVETAKQMKASLHLPPSKQPGTKLGPGVQQTHFNSDLSENLPPQEKSEHPPETYLIRQAVAGPAKASLIDEDTSDVVVIGNSYMQPKYNFAAMLSNQLDRPVSLVWKVHTVGPYRTMLNYLGSDAFKKQKPKAIVWNFHEIDMELMPDSQAAWPQDFMTADSFLSNVQHAVKA